MANILVTEKIHPNGIGLLKAAGHEVVELEMGAGEAALREKMRDADGMLVRIRPITRELMKDAKKLKIISKHGVGVDNFDLEAAKELGITVTTAPDANGLSVAEHAMALLMSLAKNVVPVTLAYKKIGFAAKNYREGVELTGKTMGIIGCGKIGRRMAAMAKNGFGMRVIAYDPYLDEAPEGVELLSERERVFREADFVSLHCYLSDETFHCVGEKEFELMKDTALLINCARGAVVYEEALIRALKDGKIAGAGLDVTEEEPLNPKSPLFAMENVLVTPHYAPATKEAATKVSEIAAQNLISFFGNGEVVGKIV